MATSSSPLFNVRIIASSPAPELELNINKGAWWPGTTRTDMTYSSTHVYKGRALEFAMAQHSRAAGDNTGVRWAEFSADGPPTLGYYWPPDDTGISETDNLPSFLLPWIPAVWLLNQKLIDIGDPPKALFRNLAGGDQSYEIDLRGNDKSFFGSIYNGACLMNPVGDYTVTFGGGHYTNWPRGTPSIWSVVEKNPDPSRPPIKVTVYTADPSVFPQPIYTRNVSQCRDWVYWGLCRQRKEDGTAESLPQGFWRAYLPDLRKGVPTVERLPDIPTKATAPGTFPLITVDDVRGQVIIVGVDGAHRYQIPADNGPKGRWLESFAPADWNAMVNEGQPSWGFQGMHRGNLGPNGQTFFRQNLSRKWNRIRWSR